MASSPAWAGKLLRFKGVAGESATYELKMAGTTTIYSGEKTSTSRLGSEVYLQQQVTEVRPDGTLDLLMKVDSARAQVDGQADAMPVGGRVTRTELKPNGETTVVGAGQGGLNLAQLQLVFPDEPVEVGTSWSRKVPPSDAVPVAMETTYKIVGFEKVNDFPCVKILSQVRSVGEPSRPGIEVKMKADGVIHFAYDQGFMVDNSVNAEMRMAFLRLRAGAEEPEKVIMKTDLQAGMAWQYTEPGSAQGDE